MFVRGCKKSGACPFADKVANMDDDEDDVCSATQCIYHATWKKYLVLSHHVTSLSTKDKRIVHSLLKRSDAKDTMFLPQYGITAGMFCTWQILRSTRRRTKKERGAVIPPPSSTPPRGGEVSHTFLSLCPSSSPQSASGEREEEAHPTAKDRVGERSSGATDESTGEAAPTASLPPCEAGVARRRSTRRGR